MKLRFFLIFLMFSMLTFAQEKRVSKYYFGYNLVDNGSGELVHFGIIRISPDGSTKVTYMDKINFFLQAAGEQESVANPDKINYWKTHKVNAKIVRELWKLKYAEYPYDRPNDNKGWAGLTYSASPSQLRFLRKYGFKRSITDFIYGEKCFKLLYDLQNPQWQNNYSNL